jgi:hypothetical protein
MIMNLPRHYWLRNHQFWLRPKGRVNSSGDATQTPGKVEKIIWKQKILSSRTGEERISYAHCFLWRVVNRCERTISGLFNWICVAQPPRVFAHRCPYITRKQKADSFKNLSKKFPPCVREVEVVDMEVLNEASWFEMEAGVQNKTVCAGEIQASVH